MREITMSDNALRQAVLDELAFDPSIEAKHVGVTALNGVVTLMGHVPSFLDKVHAEQAASRVAGVRGVANDIEVKLPEDLKESDETIAARALQCLAWDATVPKNQIQVHVASGWVTLTGMVDWAFQRIAAESDVRKLHGVVMVANNIIVQPKYAPPNAQHIRQQILDALKRNVMEHSTINVQTEGSKVILSGHVPGVALRHAAERVAWSAPGVGQVQDDLTIGV
jgi:osmotically-inducible protein OsmY